MSNVKWYESVAGPMRLVTVRSVQSVAGHGINWNRIHIEGGKLFCATGYHAFLGIRNGVETTIMGNDLRKGDRFWLDISAFGADGSLCDSPRALFRDSKVLMSNGHSKSVKKLKAGDEVITSAGPAKITNLRRASKDIAAAWDRQ